MAASKSMYIEYWRAFGVGGVVGSRGDGVMRGDRNKEGERRGGEIKKIRVKK